MTEYITLKYNIWVSKEDVRKAIKDIDPEGVDKRRKKVIHRRKYESLGPGQIYHLVGNDKLKLRLTYQKRLTAYLMICL